MTRIPQENQETIEPALDTLFNKMQGLPKYVIESKEAQEYLQLCLFLSTWHGLVIEPNRAMCDTLDSMKDNYDIDGIDFGNTGRSFNLSDVQEHRQQAEDFINIIERQGLSEDDLIFEDIDGFIDNILVVYNKES